LHVVKSGSPVPSVRHIDVSTRASIGGCGDAGANPGVKYTSATGVATSSQLSGVDAGGGSLGAPGVVVSSDSITADIASMPGLSNQGSTSTRRRPIVMEVSMEDSSDDDASDDKSPESIDGKTML